jgi:hypothetical protein
MDRRVVAYRSERFWPGSLMKVPSLCSVTIFLRPRKTSRLGRVPTRLNRLRFPNQSGSDSSSLPAKEAGGHGDISSGDLRRRVVAAVEGDVASRGGGALFEWARRARSAG